MSKGYMFIDMRWELAVKMHPNNYAYVQRALAELCVDLANRDVLDGWAIRCPNLAREKPRHNYASHMADALRYALYSFQTSATSF